MKSFSKSINSRSPANESHQRPVICKSNFCLGSCVEQKFRKTSPLNPWEQGPSWHKTNTCLAISIHFHMLEWIRALLNLLRLFRGLSFSRSEVVRYALFKSRRSSQETSWIKRRKRRKTELVVNVKVIPQEGTKARIWLCARDSRIRLQTFHHLINPAAVLWYRTHTRDFSRLIFHKLLFACLFKQKRNFKKPALLNLWQIWWAAWMEWKKTPEGSCKDKRIYLEVENKHRRQHVWLRHA